MTNMKKKIPEFKSEAEEFEFWSKADSTQYLDWSQAKTHEVSQVEADAEDGVCAAAGGDD